MLRVKECSVLVIDEGTDMNTKSHGSKRPAEHVVKQIRRATRTRFAGYPGRSAKSRHALTLQPDHLMGAGQAEWQLFDKSASKPDCQ